MKASELCAIWRRNGCDELCMKYDPVSFKLGDGDYELNTTPELVALSEKVEHEKKRIVRAPETCTSCYANSLAALGADWTHGHRPNWSVCAQCKTVYPCYCYKADIDGYGDWCGPEDNNGRCIRCGRPLGELILACIRQRKAFTALCGSFGAEIMELMMMMLNE